MMFEMCCTPEFMAFDSTPPGPNTIAATATTTIHSTISAPRSSRTAVTTFDMIFRIVVLPYWLLLTPPGIGCGVHVVRGVEYRRGPVRAQQPLPVQDQRSASRRLWRQLTA